MSKTLYCIRHGLAEHNINYGKFGSTTFYDPNFVDTSLVKEGFDQANQLRESWKEIDDIELVIVSPLQRTLQTAIEIFKEKEVPILSLEIVREYPLGKQTCNKRSPLSILKKKYPRVNFHDFKSENDEVWLSHREETIDELNVRIDLFKQYILQRPETKIAFINHGSFIGQMKDNHIRYLDNHQEELKHCYPYVMKL